MKRLLMGCFFVFLLVLMGCKKDEPSVPEVSGPTPYQLEIPKFFPTELNIPANNPLTVEGVELGRYLFYDGRLSGRTHPDSLMSCATCHLQRNGFDTGTDHPLFADGHPVGLSGQKTPHYPLPLVNLVWNPNGYLWNGYVHATNPNTAQRRLEDLVWMGVVAPHEMAGDTSRTVALFQGLSGYPALFEAAFGTSQINMELMGRAIAQFVRTLVSANSRFDRYLRGEVQLTTEELGGFVLFTTEEGADCFHCHGGAGNPLFTSHLFYNNGKDTLFTGAYEDLRDRYHITGDPQDLGAYKATTLRNIGLAGPYMHDGRFQTLDEVIDFYSHHLQWSPYIDPLMHHVLNEGVQLTPKEKSDLKAFIAALQDETFLTNPDFGPPDHFPDQH